MERDGRSVDTERAAAAMSDYAAAGLTTFDMADHYGSAELIAGAYRAGHASASGAQLFTKWVPKPGPVSKDDVRAAVDRARQRLGVEAIDLLQFHAWNYADPSWLETLFLLQELKHQGLIRHLGLTNVDAAHLHVVIASGIEVIANQVSFSLIDRRAARPLAPLCAAHGVHLLAYGTVAGGWLTERWLRQARTGLGAQRHVVADEVRTLHSRRRRVGRAAARAARGRWGRRPARRVDRERRQPYILDQPVWPASSSVRGWANVAHRGHAADLRVQIGRGDRAEIEAALATLEPIPGDCGDEYRKPPFLTASGDLSHHVDSMPPPYQVVPGADGRMLCLSGTPWESMAGYARAVRHGHRIQVSGTTPRSARD